MYPDACSTSRSYGSSTPLCSRRACRHSGSTSQSCKLPLPAKTRASGVRLRRVLRQPYRHACAVLRDAATPLAWQRRLAKHAASAVQLRIVPAGGAAESLTPCADAAGARRAWAAAHETRRRSRREAAPTAAAPAAPPHTRAARMDAATARARTHSNAPQPRATHAASHTRPRPPTHRKPPPPRVLARLCQPPPAVHRACAASPTATPVPCCAMPPPHSRGSAASPSMQQALCNSG